MDRGFKTQLFNTTLMYKFSYAWTWSTSFITRKVVLTITPLDWLLATQVIFDRNTGAKISKIKWLFDSILRYYSHFESFIGLGFWVLHPGLQLPRQLNYTKCLFALLPNVIPNAQNRALKKKRKLDSNPRYGPDIYTYMPHSYMKLLIYLFFWMKTTAS